MFTQRVMSWWSKQRRHAAHGPATYDDTAIFKVRTKSQIPFQIVDRRVLQRFWMKLNQIRHDTMHVVILANGLIIGDRTYWARFQQNYCNRVDHEMLPQSDPSYVQVFHLYWDRESARQQHAVSVHWSIIKQASWHRCHYATVIADNYPQEAKQDVPCQYPSSLIAE
jgi:hypothetical protein